jgi:hypothetical protein
VHRDGAAEVGASAHPLHLHAADAQRGLGVEELREQPEHLEARGGAEEHDARGRAADGEGEQVLLEGVIGARRAHQRLDLPAQQLERHAGM